MGARDRPRMPGAHSAGARPVTAPIVTYSWPWSSIDMLPVRPAAAADVLHWDQDAPPVHGPLPGATYTVRPQTRMPQPSWPPHPSTFGSFYDAAHYKQTRADQEHDRFAAALTWPQVSPRGERLQPQPIYPALAQGHKAPSHGQSKALWCDDRSVGSRTSSSTSQSGHSGFLGKAQVSAKLQASATALMADMGSIACAQDSPDWLVPADVRSRLQRYEAQNVPLPPRPALKAQSRPQAHKLNKPLPPLPPHVDPWQMHRPRPPPSSSQAR